MILGVGPGGSVRWKHVVSTENSLRNAVASLRTSSGALLFIQNKEGAVLKLALFRRTLAVNPAGSVRQ